MNVVVVRSSALGGRWDAGFHVALSQLGARVDELRLAVPAEEAVRRLSLVSLQDKSAMSVLLRGTRGTRRLDAASAKVLAEEYPHLALALVERGSADAVERIRGEIEKSRQALETLLALGEKRTGILSGMAETSDEDVEADASPKPF